MDGAASSNSDSPEGSVEPVRLSLFNREAETIKLHGAYLPHWFQEGRVLYFVTFRLGDSLPQEKLKELAAEKKAWLLEHPEPHDEETKGEFYRRFHRQVQRWLDAGYGSLLLRDSGARTIVEQALNHFHGSRYHLDEFVVAGNHVHVLVAPGPGHALAEILHSWKSFSAREIRKLTRTEVEERMNPVWQRESRDHIVRTEASLEKFRKYIRAH